MNPGKMCRNCESRYVGCHSQCQPYIVVKVIHTYKRDKLSREKDLKFNYTRYNAIQQGNLRQMDGFKRKSSF